MFDSDSDSNSSYKSIRTLSEKAEDEHPVSVGSFIKIISTDEELNDIWTVDYLSLTQMKLIKMENGVEKLVPFEIQEGVIQDARIQTIELVSSPVEPGYVRYRELEMDKWIQIGFEGLDVPIVGKIIAIVGDSIEVAIYENGELMTNEPFNLDFKYVGLPEGVLSIKIINDPTTQASEPLSLQQQEQQEDQDDYVIGEDVSLDVLAERDKRKFRYGLEEQTNDLLESMLSKLPANKQVEPTTLENITKNIARYTQLRDLFSVFDDNGNIMYYADKTEAVNVHGEEWKPLKNLLETAHSIGWILPIVQNTKKIYVQSGETEDIQYSSIYDDRLYISEESELYKDGVKSYVSFYSEITNKLSPFRDPFNTENNFLKKTVQDTDVIIGNFPGSIPTSTVYSSISSSSMPFQMNRYTSDINYITQTNLTKSSYLTKFHPLITGDDMYVNSFLALPSPFMRYSRIRLPGTDMIGRANMATVYPSYSRLLTAKTPISNLMIDNIQAPHNEVLGTHFKKYAYNGNDPITYEELLDYFIPTTKQIIEHQKKEISTNLSLISVMTELEPYLVYSSDLTAKQYNAIMDYTNNNIEAFFKQHVKYIKTFNEYNRFDHKRRISVFDEYISANNEYVKEYVNFINENASNYLAKNNRSFTASESLSHMLKQDCGQIYNTLCAISVSKIIAKLSKDVPALTDMTDDQVPAMEDCKSYVITKKYNTIPDMEQDNGRDIILDAEYETQTNPTPVEDGHYAILANIETGERQLYKRDKKIWVLDESVPKNVVDSDMLCHIQSTCAVNQDKCESTNQTKLKVEQGILDSRTQQMDNLVATFLDDLITECNDQVVAFSYKVLPLEHKRNYEKYLLGSDVALNEEQVSPYAKYVDPIISYHRFDRRQEYIIKFCTYSIVRHAFEEEGESPYWFYCLKTNTKLIPTFFLQLASAYVVSLESYNTAMTDVLNERKALDENGSMWIDKYSGYIIKQMDNLDTDEGYNDAGFRETSRGVLQVDEVDQELEMLNAEDFDETTIELKDRMSYDKDGRYVYGIIQTLSSHMRIDITDTFGFVINTTIKIYKDAVMSEKSFNKADTKGKTYQNYLTEQLTYLTLAVFLIVCQTRIPGLKPTGTYPGCVRSFSGYPVGNSEDKTGIIYMFCILSKTKFISVSSKHTNLEQYLTKVMTKDVNIRNLINKKRLSMADEQYMPVNEHSITKWTSFLPAIVPFKLATVTNVPENFKELLIEDIQTGNRDQHDKIGVLESKIILFSYAIQYEIQQIIKDELFIMKANEQKTTVENVCCNTGGVKDTTLDYFINKTAEIQLYNNAIIEHRHLLDCVNIITKAHTLLSSEKSRRQTFQPEPTFTSNTIYAGIIHHAGFRSNVIVPEEVSELIPAIPNLVINITDSISEIIDKLKRSNTEYTYEQLLKLLKISSKQVSYKEAGSHQPTIYSSVLGLLQQEFLSPVLRDAMTHFFTENEFEELRKYILNENDRIQTILRSLLFSTIRNKLFKEEDFDAFFLNRGRTKVYFQFLKNCISNIGTVFPKMCLTASAKVKAPLASYWGVSNTHNKALTEMYDRVYEHVVKHSGKTPALFTYVMTQSEKWVELCNQIPFEEEKEGGFLILEYCLLKVFETYTTLDNHYIQEVDIYDKPVDTAGIYARPRQSTINTAITHVIRDFMRTLINNDKHINISYQEVVDASFRLKEHEKNILLSKLNDTKDLAIDNHFKNLRIGDRWGGGENVRGYDKRRFDREREALVQQTTGNDAEAMEQNDDRMNAEFADQDGADFGNDYDNDFGDNEDNYDE